MTPRPWLVDSCKRVVRGWPVEHLWETALMADEGIPAALVVAARSELVRRAALVGEREYVEAALEVYG